MGAANAQEAPSAPPAADGASPASAGPHTLAFEAAGLERRFTLVVPAAFLAAERDRRLGALLRGDGDAAPLSDAVRRRIEASTEAAIVEEAVESAVREESRRRGLRPAQGPRVEVLGGGHGSDIRLRITFDVLPEVDPPDLGSIVVERLRAEPGEAEVAAALDGLARRHRSLRDAAEDHRAEPGDVLVCDYAGRIEIFPPSLIANPTAEGLIPGRPGRNPAGWLSAAPSGVAIAMVERGFELGVPYADIRFSGTFPARTNARVFFAPRGAIRTTAGAELCLAVHVGLVEGSLPPGAVARLVLDELGPDNDYVAHGLAEVPLPTAAPIAGQRHSFVHVVKGGAAVRSVLPRFEVGFPDGAVAADFILRIGRPELHDKPADARAAPVYEPLPGGARTDAEIELGGVGGPVPGLGEHLLGLRRGETRVVGLILPETGIEPAWAGRRAEFEVTVKAIRRPVVDDALARRLGLPDLPALKARMREGLRRRYDALARERLRAAVLDRLAEMVGDVPLPPALLQAEEERLWQIRKQASRLAPPHGGAASGTRRRGGEAALRAECRAAAARRLRLGLVLSGIARSVLFDITEEDLAVVIRREASRYPGRESELLAFFRGNSKAAEGLRSLAVEEKVLEFLLGHVRIIERLVEPEELAAPQAQAQGPMCRLAG